MQALRAVRCFEHVQKTYGYCCDLRRHTDVHHIAASDGEFGHVDDFLLDEESWEIRYLQIDTSNWIGGKTVLVSPRWTRVNWRDRAIFVEFPRELVKRSPEFDPSQPITREYEERLQQHYHPIAQRH